MDQLSLTLDEALTYEVVTIAGPPQPEWLDLPALHKRLLPLAQDAGHEKLLLSSHIGQGDAGECYYEADGAGGASGFRRYITFFDYGSSPSQFERRLTELLQEQVQFRNTLALRTHAA